MALNFWKKDCSPFAIGVLFNDISSFLEYKEAWSHRESVESTERSFCISSNNWERGSQNFNQAWLQRFPWLVYSKFLHGAFLFPCVLFTRECSRKVGRLNKLVKTSVTFWTTAMSHFARSPNGSLTCEVDSPTSNVKISELVVGELICWRNDRHSSQSFNN